MTLDPATKRLRQLESARRLLASGIHAARSVATPSLRGRKDHSTLISAATYSPWRVDSPFRTVADSVRDHTLLDEMRLYELWSLAGQVGHLNGDAIEVGCWRGGAGCLIATRVSESQPSSTTFLCDTFAGVVKAGSRDAQYRGGEHADSDQMIVTDLARRLNLAGVTVLKGMFPEETGDVVKERTFKFGHIDVDVYDSARDAFEWLAPRLILGAIVVFDDYGFSGTGGVQTYIDEISGQPEFAIVRNLNGQAVAVKRRESHRPQSERGL